MSNTIPKGRILTFSGAIILPDTATDDQIDDWINMELSGLGGVALDSPLSLCGIEAVDVSWDDTHRYRETLISEVKKDGDTTNYKLRHKDHRDTRGPSEVDAWVSPEQARKNAGLS